MQPEELAEEYLTALGEGDLHRVMALFAPGAVVHSRLYGPTPAADFYPSMLAETGASHLTLRGVTTGRSVAGTALVNVWFHYDWRLPSGRPAPFDVIDVMELDDEGLIVTLHLVYDTVNVRPVYEQETGKTSWRPGEP
ncbi:nuclear transport factor 2 family protein [Sphaerisporangium sp. TRM90804]|uniref:nuclear transport factor 2 family protein n=1 Tax=Sphaerisporangium sp. TRM90804 TaxID=3031113 RepID=UPI0024468EAB|nr:nuclear transport factor 2 family protein [Sphaerisporangium sp. TRM90804]MDH2425457.1 nuclear transport factor 2 family protein [Sphaerisporangium sp. TRM90804]